MGVLVGTALIVIIPEGVETLYSASDYNGEPQSRRSVIPHAPMVQRNLGGGQGMMTLLQRSEIPTLGEVVTLRRGEPSAANPFNVLPGPVIPEGTTMEGMSPDSPLKTPPVTPTGPGEVGILGKDKTTKTTTTTTQTLEHQHPARSPHAWIGISLIFGFILMYLLDTLPFLAPSAPARPQSNIYSLSELSSSPPSTPVSPQRSLSTTLGLCIHAAADGIALGASSTSSSTTSLSLIIFVAIMVHKAPAAFGLTSVLLKQGLGKRGARAHLVIFSLAAPMGAVGTWLIVRALGGGGSTEPAVMKWWTGVLLLFSGGTFL
jgi:zinc transporter 9